VKSSSALIVSWLLLAKPPCDFILNLMHLKISILYSFFFHLNYGTHLKYIIQIPYFGLYTPNIFELCILKKEEMYFRLYNEMYFFNTEKGHHASGGRRKRWGIALVEKREWKEAMYRWKKKKKEAK